MRLAVLSDIHGNIVALERVLADLKQAGAPDVTWVLGDLALFGSHPHEAIQGVRDLSNLHVIQGNTDRYIVTGVRPGMPRAADEAAWSTFASRTVQRDTTFLWTTERISYEDYLFLRDLPTDLTQEVDGFGAVGAFHAAPGDDEFGFFPDMPDEVIGERLTGLSARLVMMGHTHIAMDRQVADWRVLNVGSVGLPFDEDPRASYAILDFDEQGNLSLDRRRVAYDIDKAVEHFHALDHPIAQTQEARLRTGLRNPPVPTDS